MAPPDQPIDDPVRPRDGAWSWYSPGPPRRALLVAQGGTAMPARHGLLRTHADEVNGALLRFVTG